MKNDRKQNDEDMNKLLGPTESKIKKTLNKKLKKKYKQQKK